LNVERLAKNCVFLGAMLAIVCYAVAESELTWMILALAHPPAFLGWWLTERLGKRPLRKWLANAAVAGAVLWAGYVVWATRLEVSTFCQFLILVMVIRIWDTKQAKDMAQIVVLSVFLVVGAILTDTRLHLALLVLLTVPTIASAAGMLHILTSIERARRARGTDAIERAIAAPAGAARHLAVMLTLGVSIGLVVSLVVFVIMPRGIGLRALGRFGEVVSTRTGFTDTVDLRRAGPAFESEVAVMEVRLEDDTGFPMGSGDHPLYIRGVALDQYERGAWTRSARAGMNYDLRAGAWQDFSRRPGRRALVQKITVREASATSPLWAILAPVSIKSETAMTIRFSRWDDVLSRDDRQGRAGRLEYTVRSVEPPIPRESDLDRRPGSPTFPSDRVTSLAESVLVAAGIEPDVRKRAPALDRPAAEAIQTFLRTGFQYTLDTEAPPAGVDPIEAFLFERKTGHCEVFAAAMAAMCRSVGIDSRVVAGYLATEYDQAAGVYTVRERNAHAWTEVLTDNWNWRTFDATPPADLAQAHKPRDTIVARLNRWLDSLNSAWAVSVVSFDETSQRRLLGMNMNPSLEIQEKFMQWAGAAAPSRVDRGGNRWIIMGGVLCLVVGAGVLARLIYALRHRDNRAHRRPTPREARFYDDAMRALRRAGVPKPGGLTPLEHAAALAPTHPAATGVLREIGELYYLARFAGRRLSAEETARGKALVRSLRAALVPS
jgi:transglutaminase-like putative cysteine protease